MCNSKIPNKLSCSINRNNNLYHCQFPFDTDNPINNSIYLDGYKNIIVNSEFTLDYYIKFTQKYFKDQQVHIVYPCCFSKINELKYDKEPNSFVMIGRIFDYNPESNNKNFDIALKYFEKISLKNYNNFKIYIIGTVNSNKMLEKIKSFKIKNIEIFENASEDQKNNIIKKSKYIINMVGINRDKESECYSYEHFGISILEGINFGCIPITINGGYPSYYINNNTGIIFNDEYDFDKKIREIIIKNKDYEYNYKYYNNFLKKFTFDYFADSIDNIL